MANPYTRLARVLEEVRGEVRALAGTPQLAYSSLENGSIDEYDQDGNLVQVIGRQWDGTHGAYPVSGPVPPVPTAPLLTGGLGLTIGWDGTFTNDAGAQDITVTAPMDWSRVELHASQVSGFTADTADTLVDSIESPRGGSRPALVEPGTWYAVLVSRSNTGKRSAQSAESSAVVTPPVGSDIDVDALRAEFEAANQAALDRINENRLLQDALAGDVAELQEQTLPALLQDLGDAKDRLDTADGLLSITFPKRLDDMAAVAADAKTKATAAEVAAGNAVTKAGAAETAASGANTKAAAAETAAATAKTRADAAAASAATAAGNATAAESSASRASGAAGTAEAAADKARQDAAAALTQAQASGSNATAAQTAANNAKTASDAAAAQAKTAGTAAAAADAAAAKAAADAAQAAADLIVARNAAADARGDADTALGRADAALLQAGSAARVMYSIANPSGTAREGDTWRKIVSNTGDVIAEWRYTAVNGASAWRPQQVTSDMVSNLDVGKLSAGAASLTQAVIDKLVANLAQFIKADIGNLTVTGDSALNTVTAQRIAANVASFLSVTTDQLTAGKAALGDAVARKFAAEAGAFMKLYANQVFIGQGGNQLYDPQFLDTELNDIRRSFSTGTWTFVPASSTTTGNAMRTTTTTTNTAFQFFRIGSPGAARTAEFIPVSPGQVYDFSVDITTNVVANCRWNLYLLRADGTSTYTGFTQSSGTGRRELKYTYTVPEGVVGVFPAVACLTSGVTWTVHGNATFREKITPSLIIEGLMDAQRIIGASVESSSAARRGVKFNDAGIFGYDAVGNETLRLDGVNSIITGATIRTAASGARWQMSAVGLEAWNAAGERYLLGNANGLEMIGSIASKGKTAEATPRDINVRLTTVTRDILGRTSVPNPALVFDTGGAVLGDAPGIYSADGKSLTLIGGDNIWGKGVINLSPEIIKVDAAKVQIGTFGFQGTETYVTGDVINIGDRGNTTTNIRGTVTMEPHHVEYTSSASAPSNSSQTLMNGTWVKDNALSRNEGFASTPAAGRIRLQPGVYAISFRGDCGGPMGPNPELAIKNATSGEEYVALGLVAGRWNGVVSDPAIYIQYEQDLTFWVNQNSGTTRTCSGRVRIEKIK